MEDKITIQKENILNAYKHASKEQKILLENIFGKDVFHPKDIYKYFPQSKEELEEIIKKHIKDERNEVNLNDIDVSKITDMSELFVETDFCGDISEWDVSNVTNMRYMFYECTKFNSDISNWDVSNVIDMYGMFEGCELFNQDISNWDVSNVTGMSSMFYNCESFNQDISKWNVAKVKNNGYMFHGCISLEKKYKPKFK